MSTLAQLFESGEQTSQKGHFRNLILIARIDGVVSEIENKLLLKIANKLSLTEEQIKEIKENPQDYPTIPPYSMEERYERFIQLIEMATIDDVIASEELKLIEKIGLNLGFSEEAVSEKSKIIISKFQSGHSKDEILESLL